MAWLNYHHLHYFWTVARTGSLSAASEVLHLSQPTISTQINTLEDALGQQLFEKKGRRLVLTETGKTAFRYADDIFRLGHELQEVLSRGAQAQTTFNVGIVDVVPKMIAEHLLEPAFAAVDNLRLSCFEGPVDQLLARLAIHELDVVLSEEPAPPDIKVRAFSHRLGDSGTTFFGTRRFAPLTRQFPKSLQDAALLAPHTESRARTTLETWLSEHAVAPRIVADFEDSALMTAFGARGKGIFCAPTAIEESVQRQFDVSVIGRAPELRQAFYAISVERKLRHPAVVAVAAAAREELFIDS